MIEHDFLTEFEEEMKCDANASHLLDDEEREFCMQILDEMETTNEAYRKIITIIKCPEKKKQFEELYPLLIHLAEENCACLRLRIEDENLIKVELEFLIIMGGRGKEKIHGEILSKIFDLYREFTLDVAKNNHMVLKFDVPLVEEVLVRTIFDEDVL